MGNDDDDDDIDDDDDGGDVYGDENDFDGESQTQEATHLLDDSITHLKESYSASASKNVTIWSSNIVQDVQSKTALVLFRHDFCSRFKVLILFVEINRFLKFLLQFCSCLIFVTYCSNSVTDIAN